MPQDLWATRDGFLSPHNPELGRLGTQDAAKCATGPCLPDVLNMIIVSEPSAEATQLVRTGRYPPVRRRSSAAQCDTPRYVPHAESAFTQECSRGSPSPWTSSDRPTLGRRSSRTNALTCPGQSRARTGNEQRERIPNLTMHRNQHALRMDMEMYT